MIGYYVHHQGQGHLTRAACIAAASSEDVVVLSSLAAPAPPSPFADWVELPRDDADGDRDATAGGALHWAPLDSAGHRARMAGIADWVTRAAPRLVVIDVSVEVATFVRLLGVPVVVMAAPGRRDDPVHQLGYRLASAILAPWPREVYDPAYLQPWTQKVTHVGALSRFDGRPVSAPGGGRRVLALFGSGGCEVSDAQLTSAQAATPGWSWTAAGGPASWTAQVWPDLLAADVVVAHAGLNVVAEIAAARRAAVLLPQPRPFDEQHETASALHAAGIVHAASSWPAAPDWAPLLEAAIGRGGAGWASWNAGSGAARAAEVLAGLHV